MDNKARGFHSESAVISLMESKGYTLLVRNFNVHNSGELDAVMTKDDTVAVIEVKSRRERDGDYGAASAITPGKIMRMRKTVNVLISRYGLWDKDIVFLGGLVTHRADGSIASVEVVPIEL